MPPSGPRTASFGATPYDRALSGSVFGRGRTGTRRRSWAGRHRRWAGSHGGARRPRAVWEAAQEGVDNRAVGGCPRRQRLPLREVPLRSGRLRGLRWRRRPLRRVRIGGGALRPRPPSVTPLPVRRLPVVGAPTAESFPSFPGGLLLRALALGRYPLRADPRLSASQWRWAQCVAFEWESHHAASGNCAEKKKVGLGVCSLDPRCQVCSLNHSASWVVRLL